LARALVQVRAKKPSARSTGLERMPMTLGLRKAIGNGVKRHRIHPHAHMAGGHFNVLDQGAWLIDAALPRHNAVAARKN
jgi:hypothetical protein